MNGSVKFLLPVVDNDVRAQIAVHVRSLAIWSVAVQIEIVRRRKVEPGEASLVGKNKTEERTGQKKKNGESQFLSHKTSVQDSETLLARVHYLRSSEG